MKKEFITSIIATALVTNQVALPAVTASAAQVDEQEVVTEEVVTEEVVTEEVVTEEVVTEEVVTEEVVTEEVATEEVVQARDAVDTRVGESLSDWAYSYSEGTVTLTGYIGKTVNPTEVVVPGSFTEFPNANVVIEKNVIPASAEIIEFTRVNGRTAMLSSSWGYFQNNTNVRRVIMPNLSVDSSNRMFEGCTNLEYVDLSGLNISNAVNIDNMFKGCSNLTYLNLDKMIIGNSTGTGNKNDIFTGMPSTAEIIMTNWTNSSTETRVMNDIIEEAATHLSDTLDLSGLNVINDTDIAYMFDQTGANDNYGIELPSKIKTINLTGASFGKNTTLKSFFQGCSNIENIGLDNLYIPAVTTMEYMFNDCEKLVNVSGEINTSNVTNMHDIFANCEKLTNIELEKWDVSKVTNLQGAFWKVKSLDFSKIENWDTSNVTNMGGVLREVNYSQKLNLSNWNTSKVVDLQCAFMDSNITDLDISGWDLSNIANMNNMFKNYKGSSVNMKGITFNNEFTSNDTFANVNEELKIDLTNWICNNNNMRSITDFINAIIANTDMETLDLRGWKCSNVTDLSAYFDQSRGNIILDSQIKNINLSNWETPKNTNLGHFFRGCRNVDTIDVSGWNVSNLQYLDRFVDNCPNLTKLNLTGWIIPSNTSMEKFAYINTDDIATYKELTIVTTDQRIKDYNFRNDNRWSVIIKDSELRVGLVEIDGFKYYYTEDGEMVTSDWVELDSVWYYFGKDGKMVTGLQTIKGQTYFFNEEGQMQTGVVNTGDGLYYFDNAGRMVKKTGWIKYSDTYIYLDSEYKAQTGWQIIEERKYYFNPETGLMTKGWATIDGVEYYFNNSGAMQTQWVELGDPKVWYYFDQDGLRATGLKEIEGKTYYFNDKGQMQTGWHEIDGKTYYFHSGGAMQQNWIKIGNDYYYLSNGEKASGWKQIGGKWYYFYPETGIMASNTTIDGYEIDANGVANRK